MTKREWLKEYLVQVEEYNNNLKVKKIQKEKVKLGPFYSRVTRSPAFRFSFAFTMVVVLIIGGIIWARDSLEQVIGEI
ncbi:MAG: hypothetical protein ACE5GI_09090, partial [Candidatus Aminicenantales bacterium]